MIYRYRAVLFLSTEKEVMQHDLGSVVFMDCILRCHGLVWLETSNDGKRSQGIHRKDETAATISWQQILGWFLVNSPRRLSLLGVFIWQKNIKKLNLKEKNYTDFILCETRYTVLDDVPSPIFFMAFRTTRFYPQYWELWYTGLVYYTKLKGFYICLKVQGRANISFAYFYMRMICYDEILKYFSIFFPLLLESFSSYPYSYF